MAGTCKIKALRKTLSKYIVAFFNYFGKTLLVLSAISGGASIASFVTSNSALVEITSAKKKEKKEKNNWKKEKRNNKTDLLARSKLNRIENIKF